MAKATVVAVDPPTEPPSEFINFGTSLQIEPLDNGFFSHHAFDNDGAAREGRSDDVVVLEDLDFNFSFDNLSLPPADSLDHPLSPSQMRQFLSHSGADSSFEQVGSNYHQMRDVFKSSTSELLHLSGDGDLSGNWSCDGSDIIRYNYTKNKVQ